MRETPKDRLLRVLSILSWTTQHPGTSLEELCERFTVSRAQLLKDLESLIPFCGLPPYTPDRLIDVTIEQDRVHIRFAEYFDDPIAFTPEEGLNLLLAAETLLSVDPNNLPLESALHKLRAHLSVTVAADFPHLTDIAARIAAAMEQDQSLEISYYSFHRNASTQRVVDPIQRFWADGNWYIAAFCHQANAERFFRLDRIQAAELTGQQRTVREAEPPALWADLEEETTRVVVECEESIGAQLEAAFGAIPEPSTNNSTYRWQIFVGSSDAMARISFRFSGQIHIVEPHDVRDEVEILRGRILAAYASHARLPE